MLFTLANRGGREGRNGASGTPVVEDKLLQAATPTLRVRILRKQRYCELADAVPVRTGDKLQISVRVPAGINGVLLLLGSDGQVQMLAQAAASQSPQSMAYPATADMAAPLVGKAGTEVLLAPAGDLRPDLSELKSLLGDGTAWPAPGAG